MTNIKISLHPLLKLWHEATKKNAAKAQFQAAQIHSAIESESAKVKAFEWYKKAAKNHCTDAMFMLARCYHDGLGVKRNYKQACRWYKRAEDNVTYDLMNNPDPIGDAAAKRVTAYFQNGGSHEELLADCEDEPSFDEIYKFAERGNAREQQILGWNYYHGRGIEQDYGQAQIWYSRAARQGNEVAMGRLAELYETGKGGIQSYQDAAKWYQQYAEARIRWRNKRLGWTE